MKPMSEEIEEIRRMSKIVLGEEIDEIRQNEENSFERAK